MKFVNNSLNLISNAVETTERIGEKIGRLLKQGDVVCLIGELGAGKTALTRGIGRGWGTFQRVTSPTFTLINEYSREQDDQILYHLDCYRLMSDDDVETIGLDDILSAEGSIVIEWPQVAQGWLPADHLSIKIEAMDEHSRQLTLIAQGERSNTLLQSLDTNH